MNYPAPQYPGYPQQPYAQPQPPAYPQAPPPVQQPVQPYGQPVPQTYGQFPAAPAIPTQPLANGTLDDYFSQPSTGGGPSISWKGKPDGTTYLGVVARDVSSGDVVHDTDPQTKQPKYFRDGRPMFSMKVPLKIQGHPEFPEGDANLWVRGSMRDELARAMTEAGADGAPKAGDVLQVTLVQRKPSQGGIPANVFHIAYQRQGAAPQQIQQAPAAPAPQQYAQPVQQAPQMQQAPPAVQYAPAAPAQAPVQQQIPATPVAPAAPDQQLPSDLTPEQQELLARLAGGQAAPGAA